MLTKRVLGLVMALVVLGVVSAGQTTAQAVAPAVTATTNLSDAVNRTNAADYRVFVRGGAETFSGVVDAAAKAALLSYSDGTNNLTFVTTPATLYASGLPGYSAEKSVALETSSLVAACRFAAVADPAVGLSLALASTTVQQVSGDSVQGTLDLARVSGSASTLATVRYLYSITAGDTSAVAFSAMIENGFVTLFQATFPKANADGTDLVYVLQISAIGADNRVDLPDQRNVVNAPPELYGT
jgi:hypothetical protein